MLGRHTPSLLERALLAVLAILALVVAALVVARASADAPAPSVASLATRGIDVSEGAGRAAH